MERVVQAYDSQSILQFHLTQSERSVISKAIAWCDSWFLTGVENLPTATGERIQESSITDYRFRALATRLAMARACAQMVELIDYDNFKSKVSSRQGKDRARLYHDVWSVLYRLQVQKSTLR